MTILIIGATGFLGTNLLAQLKKSGTEVVGTTRSTSLGAGMFSIDLGRRGESTKIISLVEKLGITYIVNMAASDVSPSTRTKLNEERIHFFFENLRNVLNYCRDLNLLHIGTLSHFDKSDAYFVEKSLMKDLLQTSNVREQVAILDLPKVVGPGEPLGRFTSDLIDSLILGEKRTVLHPCHKRNFISLFDVISLIMEIMKASGSGATQYPMYRTELLSNYDIAKDIMRISLSNTDQIMFDHSRSTKTCLRCPSDEGELLIKPEFPGPQTVNYYLTTPTQTVEEALISQFENVKFAYESRQNLCENGEQ